MILNAILLSMLPVSELRGGIPLAVYSGNNIFIAYIVCVLANMLVIPIVFFFLDYLHDHFMKIPIYKKVFDKFLERTRRRTEPIIKKYGYIGLTLFVAIPLPVTGAYTGTLAAWLFNIRGRRAYFALMLGVLIAGLVVSVVTITGSKVFSIFIT